MDPGFRQLLLEAQQALEDDPIMLKLRRAVVFLLIQKHLSELDAVPDSSRVRRALSLLRSVQAGKGDSHDLVARAIHELEDIQTGREHEEMLLRLMDQVDKLYDSELRMRKEGQLLSEKEVETHLLRMVEAIEKVLPEHDAKRVIKQIEAYL